MSASASANSMAGAYEGKDKEPSTLNTPYTPKNLQEFLISFVQEESNLPVCILIIAIYLLILLQRIMQLKAHNLALIN
jgi:hypothetical protein